MFLIAINNLNACLYKVTENDETHLSKKRQELSIFDTSTLLTLIMTC